MLAANTTAVVRHRLAVVSNWGAMKTACGSSGTQLVVIGNSNKTLDARENG
jgi:hypothetical protein